MTHRIYVFCQSIERFDVEGASNEREARDKYDKGECTLEADEVQDRQVLRIERSVLSQITICGILIHLGDRLEVEYTTGERMKGGRITGTVTELWEAPNLQARLSNGWCFHNHDRIIFHESNE